MPREKDLFRLAGLGLLGLFLLGSLGLVSPEDLTIPWKCPFRALTGHPCPGCGMTDALKALLSGHLKEAFLANPNLYPLLAFTFAFALSPEKALYLGEKKGLFFWWLGLIFVWWVVRLLGLWPQA